MSNKKIAVTVQYVGNSDFHDEFPPEVAFQAIEVQALRAFGLEPSAASKYVLQYNGADLPQNGHLSSLNANPVVLRLVLKEEVPKGAAWAMH